ncbi:MAG: flagellar export chaperone FliS [Clostridiales bacterium]
MMKQTYQTYKQQSVMTMTSTEMLTMLYDGILKELYLVEKAFEGKNYAEINRGLQKVQRILNHLKTTLDMNYDIAKNLMSLYDYFSWVVTQANLKKDPAKLGEVAEMITELKESYIQADRKARMHA